MRNKESIRHEVEALILPPIVLQIFDGTASRSELSYRCANPYNSLIDDSAFPDRILPLWECGTTVTGYDRIDQVFCKLDLEDADHPWFRVKDFDGVVADLLIELWEDEIPDSILAELANAFGFSRLDPLITALEAGPSGDYPEWRASLRTGSE